MKRKVTALEARRKLGELLEGVYYRGDEVIIERDGKPMGVVVPTGRYASIERARERLWASIEAIWEANRDRDPATLEREIAEAMSAGRALEGDGTKAATDSE